jgi:hypothetical protein
MYMVQWLKNTKFRILRILTLYAKFDVNFFGQLINRKHSDSGTFFSPTLSVINIRYEQVQGTVPYITSVFVKCLPVCTRSLTSWPFAIRNLGIRSTFQSLYYKKQGCGIRNDLFPIRLRVRIRLLRKFRLRQRWSPPQESYAAKSHCIRNYGDV